ncbi:MAG: ATP-dependent protease subunit HslV [Sphaerochaetaceae bacterium]
MEQFKGTTIIAVRKDGKVAIAGDGQVTQGNQVVLKGNAHKVRRLYEGKVLIGFAGGTADAFTLCELFEQKLKQFSGDITRSAVDLAKQWRSDKQMRQMEAMMLATDGQKIFLIDGVGDVIDPEGDAIGIGSGGNFAYSAALAYLDCAKEMSAKEIARKSLEIASDICIFTNKNIIVEEL